MARNSIGFKRGSVRGAPPQVYVPFGAYGPTDESIRGAIRFFGTWLQAAIIFVVIILALAILVTFTDDYAN
jgi:hypothetical protein